MDVASIRLLIAIKESADSDQQEKKLEDRDPTSNLHTKQTITLRGRAADSLNSTG